MAQPFDVAQGIPSDSRGMRLSVIVCAHNEARYLPACLHSLLSQTRLPDEILVVNNASTDATRAVALEVPHVRVVDGPRKGLVIARETGRRSTSGDVLVYLDADCRAPLTWLARIEARFAADETLLALSGPYRFYDWDWWGRLLIRAYDFTLAPATQLLASSGRHLRILLSEISRCEEIDEMLHGRIGLMIRLLDWGWLRRSIFRPMLKERTG
jgi:glycosyltransferase involved in cell wall biosynthesis